MIHLSHIYKTYDGSVVSALRNIDLFIEKGEFVFLTGPSGAGKTTLFNLISAFDKADSGKINIAGFDLNTLKNQDIPLLRRKIGMIYQDFKLLENISVFDNVAMPLQVRKERSVVIKQKVESVLAKVSLGSKVYCKVNQLSGGEKQRVAIARALVHQPGILIADEPTGNLDPVLSEEIMDLLESVNAQGTTVFVASHDSEMVKRRNKKCIKLDQGLLVRGVDEITL